MNHLLLSVSVLCLVILLGIVVLKKVGQPYSIAYILAGIVLGPELTGMFSDPGEISNLGEMGILFLMFFLGLDLEIPDKKELLLRPVIAQILKTLLTIGASIGLRTVLHLSYGETAILCLLLVFNSTAVTSEYLRTTGELGSNMGKLILTILILQDILIAPALTAAAYLGNQNKSWVNLVIPVLGCLIIPLILRAVRNRNLFQLRVWKAMETDHELQVFSGILICIGFAWIAAAGGLSAPLGSFVAGILLGRTYAFRWLGQILIPFKIFFLALFFVSIGLSIDLGYARMHLVSVIMITGLIILLNSVLTTLVFRLLKFTWKDSLYGGTLLSNTGELGLLVCSVAHQSGIVSAEFLRTAVIVTAGALLLSTLFMSVFRLLSYKT